MRTDVRKPIVRSSPYNGPNTPCKKSRRRQPRHKRRKTVVHSKKEIVLDAVDKGTDITYLWLSMRGYAFDATNMTSPSAASHDYLKSLTDTSHNGAELIATATVFLVMLAFAMASTKWQNKREMQKLYKYVRDVLSGVKNGRHAVVNTYFIALHLSIITHHAAHIAHYAAVNPYAIAIGLLLAPALIHYRWIDSERNQMLDTNNETMEHILRFQEFGETDINTFFASRRVIEQHSVRKEAYMMTLSVFNGITDGPYMFGALMLVIGGVAGFGGISAVTCGAPVIALLVLLSVYTALTVISSVYTERQRQRKLQQSATELKVEQETQTAQQLLDRHKENLQQKRSELKGDASDHQAQAQQIEHQLHAINTVKARLNSHNPGRTSRTILAVLSFDEIKSLRDHITSNTTTFEGTTYATKIANLTLEDESYKNIEFTPEEAAQFLAALSHLDGIKSKLTAYIALFQTNDNPLRQSLIAYKTQIEKEQENRKHKISELEVKISDLIKKLIILKKKPRTPIYIKTIDQHNSKILNNIDKINIIKAQISNHSNQALKIHESAIEQAQLLEEVERNIKFSESFATQIDSIEQQKDDYRTKFGVKIGEIKSRSRLKIKIENFEKHYTTFCGIETESDDQTAFNEFLTAEREYFKKYKDHDSEQCFYKSNGKIIDESFLDKKTKLLTSKQKQLEDKINNNGNKIPCTSGFSPAHPAALSANLADDHNACEALKIQIKEIEHILELKKTAKLVPPPSLLEWKLRYKTYCTEILASEKKLYRDFQIAYLDDTERDEILSNIKTKLEELEKSPSILNYFERKHLTSARDAIQLHERLIRTKNDAMHKVSLLVIADAILAQQSAKDSKEYKQLETTVNDHCLTALKEFEQLNNEFNSIQQAQRQHIQEFSRAKSHNFNALFRAGRGEITGVKNTYKILQFLIETFRSANNALNSKIALIINSILKALIYPFIAAYGCYISRQQYKANQEKTVARSPRLFPGLTINTRLATQESEEASNMEMGRSTPAVTN